MNEKIDEYFSLMHPEYNSLNEEEQKRMISDRTFIRDNLNKIERMYKIGIENGIEPSNAIGQVVNRIKCNKYRDILYSDEMDFVQEEHFSKRQQEAYDKRQQELGEKIDFVRDHIDEIDKYYQEIVQEKKGTRYEKMTEQQILQEVIDRVREVSRENDVTIDESKYKYIYGKARERITKTVSKIKSIFNIRSKKDDKTNDENEK